MAQLVQIQQCRAEYSENILPIMEDRTLIITSGMANGAVNYNTNFHFDEGSSIKIDIKSSGLNKFINFNLSDYSVTAPKTANYIFSYRLKKVNQTDRQYFASCSNGTNLEIQNSSIYITEIANNEQAYFSLTYQTND